MQAGLGLVASPHRLSWYQRLKKAAKALKHEVLAVYYAMLDPQTPFLAKALTCLVLAYALSPLDLIPDFIPVLGILDDLILLPLLIAAAIALLPPGVMEAARRRASQEPIRLSRNWPMAVCIAALWVACLEWLMYWLVNQYGNPVMRQYLPYGMVGLGAVCAGGFVVWLVGRVRKERTKQRKLAMKAAAAARKAAAAVPVASSGVMACEGGEEGGSVAALVSDVEAALHLGDAGEQPQVVASDTECRGGPLVVAGADHANCAVDSLGFEDMIQCWCYTACMVHVSSSGKE
ncbi:hypothetical protein VOLCADRAFT_85776 [Volvox carteri f. nagariensis]|uniref:DUF1232 domain-containing protein n=1 Tax=Volvox carteri f. nagariensis TaxID=3068 RepID=D8TGY4_VOLCA|nr:uncharacterized protein VOLCADRAFT_85776 [Volvox carteri f. nagariensis]EFJ52614.1 hypothetical protein VOLCADRAFT_85776 [Volvox carteri f. nagariensis]|eukprot:XP_002945619.1 hypothetical protein VOLCADRAFT_85776 [Volvox carteri f. nagariensis]